jgi:ferredoxin/flavodoxin
MAEPSIGIFYFSGTGNTGIVADLLAQAFEHSGCRVETTFIDQGLIERPPDVDGYDLVGIGYPVHAFNAPRVVFEFIDRLPVVRDKRAFTFKSPGDSLCQGGATSFVRRRLARRGYDVFHETTYVMPANVGVRYDERLVKQLYEKAVEKAPRDAEEILAGQRRLQRNGFLLKLVTWLFSSGERRGARFFGRHLRVSEACTRCGQCARECPTGNIRLTDDGVRFDWNCTLCMHCIYTCPAQAITHPLFGFAILKGGYDIQPILDDVEVRGDFITEETRGYFAHLWDYLSS